MDVEGYVALCYCDHTRALCSQAFYGMAVLKLRGGTNMNWIHKVKIKHFLTEEEDYESVQKSMAAIADVLYQTPCFVGFKQKYKFKEIPEGNEVLGPVDFANKLMERLYDYADANAIWIE